MVGDARDDGGPRRVAREQTQFSPGTKTALGSFRGDPFVRAWRTRAVGETEAANGDDEVETGMDEQPVGEEVLATGGTRRSRSVIAR